MKKVNNFFALCVVAVLVLSITVSCTDEKGARKTLERHGFKPLEVGGYGWFDGSKSDVYRTRFKAIAPNGEIVTGCVTSGWFEGHTIRLD